MRGPKTELMKKVDQYCRGCKAEVYAGICRPWLYLTFRSGGMLVTAFFNLAGGLFGAFGLLDKESRVPFPRSWGRVSRIGPLLMIYENEFARSAS